MLLVFILFKISIAMAVDDFSAQADELANAQKSPIKEIILKKNKEFKDQNADHGISKAQYDLLKRFASSISNLKSKDNSASPTSLGPVITSSVANQNLKTPQAEMDKHIAKINQISSLAIGNNPEARSKRCSALLDYYETLVLKTATQKLEVSPRHGIVVYEIAPSTKNYPFVQMSQSDIQKEYELMSNCDFTQNSVFGSLGNAYANVFHQFVRVTYVTNKIDDKNYLANGYELYLNPLSHYKNQSVTKSRLKDEMMIINADVPISVGKDYYFFGLYTGAREAKLPNQTLRLPVYRLISTKALDALLIRGVTLEGSLNMMPSQKRKCGFLTSTTGDGLTTVMNLACLPKSDIDSENYYVKGHRYLYPMEDR